MSKKLLWVVTLVIICNFFNICTAFSQSIASTVLSTSVSASNKSTSWLVNWESSKSFIENKGQFNRSDYFGGSEGRNKLCDSEILYAVDQGAVQIFFTKKGLTYRFCKKEKNSNRKKGDTTQPKYITKGDFVNITWEGANSDAVLIGEGRKQDYHTYSMLKEDGSAYDITNINGYKKLIYKNLYPDIDVIYEFHPETGVKYSMIAHPGADVSKVKMNYPDDRELTIDDSGNIHIPTLLGDIIDHAPLTFYSGDKHAVIPSKFVVEGKTISFELGNFDKSKIAVIDPWTQTPTLANSNCVWECERDSVGNVYIIGGDMPMKLLKYSSTGALQWTYTTPWDTANNWLGTFATDLAGNSYVTSGSIAKMQKINTSGSMVWSVSGGSVDEYWNIVFNCDQTKMIVGGTRIVGLPSPTGDGVIFDINTSNGSVTNMKTVGKSRSYSISIPGFPPQTVTDINEVRSISSSRNAKYYYLTLDSVGFINQNLSACSNAPPYSINSTYNFGYKCENYRPDNGNSGIMAIRANGNFVYTQNGITIHKRSLVNLAIISSASIPGGINTSGQGLNQPGNSGIDLDSCGNVYVGSGNAVIKYDANLNLITSVATSFAVFDVTVSKNGDVIVCGATGNSSSTSRTGYVQSINMSSCDPMILVCCDATVCPVGPMCTTDTPVTLIPITAGGTWSGPGVNSSGIFNPAIAGVGTHTIGYTLACGSDSIIITVSCCGAVINPAGPFCLANAPVNLMAAQSGGTWSGNGITNTSTGTFSPSAAGIGTHIITYTIGGCGSDTVSITVNACATLTACKETNGSITVSNGTSPYTWYKQTTTQNCSACFPPPFPPCSSPPGCAVNVTSWTQFATGTNATPPSFPILIVDANSDSLQISNLSSLPNCSTCTPPTATTSSTAASCGLSNGSATLTASGGSSPYTYLWSNGKTTSTITGLSAGSYSVTVTENGGCTKVASVIVSSTSGMTASTSSTNATCGLSNGTAAAAAAGSSTPYTYAWSNGKTTSTITGLAAGNYSVTVTDANSCTVVASAAVSQTASPTVSISSTNATCGASNGTAAAATAGGNSPYSYLWSNGKTTSSITGLAAGNYNVTVTDANSCTVIASAAVGQTSAPTVTTSSTNASCGASNGTATAAVAGGSTPYTYSWSNGSTAQTATGLNAGNYTVTVKDATNCTVMATVSVINPNAPSATISSTNASCNTNNGMAASAVTGGTSPYSFLWSNGKTTSSITGLAAGSYSVTITDENNCSVVASAFVNQPSPPTVTASATATGCGTSTGTATATVAGGSSPYTYLWSDGSTVATASGLSAGSWSVTVTDSANCKDSATVMVGTSAPPTVAVSSTNASCGVSNGTVAAAVAGGSSPYFYLWSNGKTTSTITGLPAGTYTVTVTDANNCTTAATDTVSNPNAPAATASSSTASCNINNGTATVAAAGGSPPYTYLWNDSAASTTASVTGLKVGNYTVTVTDSAGCSTAASVTVINIVPTTSATSSNPTCFDSSDGSASLTVSGGNSPYTYLWNTNPAQSDTTATGLKAGSYSVTVTDSIGCKSIQNVTINNPPALISSITNDTVLCENTTALLTVISSSPAKYSWSTGSSSSTSGNISSSSDSTFYVTVTKPDGSCPEKDSVVVNVIKTTASIAGDTAVCAGMQGSLTAGGGSKYIWSTNDTTKTIFVTPSADSSYLVTVTTSCGPRLASSIIQVLSPPVASAGTDTSVQSGGSIKLTASGGVSYLWSTGASGSTITVSPAATTTYNVTVTNAQGCTNVSKVTVNIDDSKCTIFIPTIFTPNGDGNNDMLFVRGYGIKELRFTIYDRWGEKVFYTEKLNSGWDGKINNGEANSAVFVYILDAVCVNGEVKMDKGNISMVK